MFAASAWIVKLKKLVALNYQLTLGEANREAVELFAYVAD